MTAPDFPDGDDYLAIIFLLFCALVLALAFYFGILPANAHDDGQWGNNDPKVSEWYRELKQPDNPNASCCGEADAYWCDDIHVKDGHTFCAITDDRPDEPRKRPHLEVGTVIEIPAEKLKWDRGNPTGHSIVFIGRPGAMNGTDVNGPVYCFVQTGGA
jgi:hypothetical protein